MQQNSIWDSIKPILCPNNQTNLIRTQNTGCSILFMNTFTNPRALFLQEDDQDDKPRQQLQSRRVQSGLMASTRQQAPQTSFTGVSSPPTQQRSRLSAEGRPGSVCGRRARARSAAPRGMRCGEGAARAAQPPPAAAQCRRRPAGGSTARRARPGPARAGREGGGSRGPGALPGSKRDEGDEGRAASLGADPASRRRSRCVRTREERSAAPRPARPLPLPPRPAALTPAGRASEPPAAGPARPPPAPGGTDLSAPRPPPVELYRARHLPAARPRGTAGKQQGQPRDAPMRSCEAGLLPAGRPSTLTQQAKGCAVVPNSLSTSLPIPLCCTRV